jgi:hypothetical protein
VLVVDDDNGQRTLLKTMLSKEGYEVDTAEDGDLAVKAAQRMTYDVILMDGFMPSKTGWETTTDIRSDEIAQGVEIANRCAIIGVTGATSKEDEEKCFESGMTDVISKPVKRENLMAKVMQWTQGKEAARASKKAEVVVSADNSAAGSPQRSIVAVVYDTDKANRVVLKGIFKVIGATVDFADTHADCMVLMATKQVDMVLLNTELESIDFMFTIAEIRKIHNMRVANLMPIFAISASKDPSRLVREGFTAVFRKPLDRNEIKETVLKCLFPSEKAVAGGAAGCNSPEHLALSRQSCGPSSAPDIVGARENEEKVVRVLIVEDHWANRRLLETMLRKQGSEFLMEAVENGQEAVHITSARQYDIILMDCNMPIKDGWQATEEIRQMAGPNKMTPIIAVTANAMKGDREKCMAAGMDDYISKPVDRKRLQEVLSKWVSHLVRSGESFN